MLNGILKQAESVQRSAPKLQELRKACQGVEAVFVKDLLAAMRKGMPKSELSDQGAGSEIYKDMFDQAIADRLSQTGSLGIANVLYRTLSEQVMKTAAAQAASKAVNKT